MRYCLCQVVIGCLLLASSGAFAVNICTDTGSVIVCAADTDHTEILIGYSNKVGEAGYLLVCYYDSVFGWVRIGKDDSSSDSTMEYYGTEEDEEITLVRSAVNHGTDCNFLDWTTGHLLAEIYADDGYDQIYGSDFDDILSGEGDDDAIVGYEGNDMMYGGSGTDWLIGREDDDCLYGGDGTDYCEGEGGTSGGANYQQDCEVYWNCEEENCLAR